MSRVASLVFVTLAIFGAGCLDHNPVAQTQRAALPNAPVPMVAPWSPPDTKLPPEFVDTVAFLLQHGMADPRGGQFAEATVRLTCVSGFTNNRAILGFYFADRNEIVSLMGLRYPVVELKGLREEFAPKPDPRVPNFSMEGQDVLAAALFLIRGNVALAEEAYNPRPSREHPFEVNATAYLSARFDRGLTAHMIGEYERAMPDFLELRRVRDAFETKLLSTLSEEEIALRRKAFYPKVTAESGFFSFLGPLEQMAQDCHRRIVSPTPIPPNPAAITNQRERIRALILDLENVDARQMGQPGGVDLFADRRVKALIAEGEPAIDPLLDTMERDRRMTRSVGFARNFVPPRFPKSVALVARETLRSILQISELPVPEGQAEVQVYRDFWKETRGLTPPERWMQTLRDGRAGRARWLDAAKRLMDPRDVTRHNESIRIPTRPPGTPIPPINAELLRARKNPSLSELLAKRSRDLLADPYPQWYEQQESLQLALMLHRWDPKAALPTLQESGDRVWKLQMRNRYGSLEAAMAEVAAARADLGDRKALDQWWVWLQKEPVPSNSDVPRVLAPLYRLRKDPEMVAAAERIFRGLGSPWNLADLARDNPSVASNVFDSPLITLPPVQESLLQLLRDRRPVPTTSGADPARGLRIADQIAQRTWGFRSAPRFNAGASVTERDAVLEELQKYFRADGATLFNRLTPHDRWEDWP